jgi:hypothetical protein
MTMFFCILLRRKFQSSLHDLYMNMWQISQSWHLIIYLKTFIFILLYETYSWLHLSPSYYSKCAADLYLSSFYYTKRVAGYVYYLHPTIPNVQLIILSSFHYTNFAAPHPTISDVLLITFIIFILLY